MASDNLKMNEENQEISLITKSLTEEEKKLLNVQNSRIISDYKAKQLELNAKKYWDLFYKRNDTRFFKNRHWTTREFQELLPTENCVDIGDDDDDHPINIKNRKILLEIGCGVGNLIFPLIEDKFNSNYFIYACDFSTTAIDLVKTNPLYNEMYVKAFQTDITTDNIYQHIAKESLDIITMVFVLSAIHPDKFKFVLNNIYTLLKPGGILLFRDYGLYDMAQLRFKPGNKISDNLYMRQDGTRYIYNKNLLIYLFK